MTEKSKLIIRGSSGKSLYYGEGTIGQWKEKLGGTLREDSYTITQIELLDLSASANDLQITNSAFLRNQQTGQYTALPANCAQYHLDTQSKNLLLELINSVPEQQEGR